MNGKHALLTFGFVLATGHAAAQTTAVGPYYATPSWDQTIPASTRFVVLSNFDSNAVLDRETGLVWQRAASATPKRYDSAANACASLAIGRLGWRLPSLAELHSLLDPSVPLPPYLPAGHPFTGFPLVSFSMWSSTKMSLTGMLAGVTYGSHAQVGQNFSSPPVSIAPLVIAPDYIEARYVCVRGGTGPDFLY